MVILDANIFLSDAALLALDETWGLSGIIDSHTHNITPLYVLVFNLLLFINMLTIYM